jgi:hypothetical protein
VFAELVIRGDPAVEKAHVTLGKCPHTRVVVRKPSGHFLFLLRAGLHESELASDDAGALQNDFHIR